MFNPGDMFRVTFGGQSLDVRVEGVNDDGGCLGSLVLVLVAAAAIFGLLPYTLGYLIWRPIFLGEFDISFDAPGALGGTVYWGGFGLCLLLLGLLGFTGARKSTGGGFSRRGVAFATVLTVTGAALALVFGPAQAFAARQQMQERADLGLQVIAAARAAKVSCWATPSDANGGLIGNTTRCAPRMKWGVYVLSIRVPGVSASDVSAANLSMGCDDNGFGGGTTDDSSQAVLHSPGGDSPSSLQVNFIWEHGNMPDELTCEMRYFTAAGPMTRWNAFKLTIPPS